MANFVKVRFKDEGNGTMFNLDAIESVNLDSRRVYTIGATHPYVINDDKSWEKIIDHVRRHTSERHF